LRASSGQIRVNGIARPSTGPGGLPESLKTEILRKTALQRMGTPDDVARGRCLAADAPYVTSQIIVVDGGRSL
jgi:pteridine reductase